MRVIICFLGTFIWFPVLAQTATDPQKIIDRFVEAETRLLEEFQHYTYIQTIRFQELGKAGTVKGERLVRFEIFFSKSGERDVRKTYDHGKLATLRVSREDLEDAVEMQPFMLTTENLDNYRIVYIGEEKVDELNTYVFHVKPKRMRRGERYFTGKIYVENQDFLIVMTQGKIVPDARNNKFPEFETIREEVEKGVWFPIWTGADDHLRFGSPFQGGSRSVHVRMYITYEDFQRYEVDTAITFDELP
jgi:hypothetical protein